MVWFLFLKRGQNEFLAPISWTLTYFTRSPAFVWLNRKFKCLNVWKSNSLSLCYISYCNLILLFCFELSVETSWLSICGVCMNISSCLGMQGNCRIWQVLILMSPPKNFLSLKLPCKLKDISEMASKALKHIQMEVDPKFSKAYLNWIKWQFDPKFSKT